MKSRTNPLLTVVVALASISVTACHAWVETDDGSGAANQRFVEILSGPAWEKYDPAALVAEGKKACDAFAAGKTAAQVMDTFEKDMNADPGMAGQFIGAVTGGLNCYPR